MNAQARHPQRIGNSEIVAVTVCCVPKCTASVEVTETGAEALRAFNTILDKQDQFRLKMSECIFCDSCAAKFAEGRQKASDAKSIKLKEIIARLKDGGNDIADRQYVKKHANEGDAILMAIDNKGAEPEEKQQRKRSTWK